MQYGFVIDNRKCIGCHACTTACKSEHQVPVGVNRTYVKYVEKGTFPNNRRLFSVMRCNHCTDAPCVSICPVEALFIRPDGIVDFDKSRCIGCKSCMQACPYDALYIDPETHTAAKCNYCAHRVDIGLEPACVTVCPEHAIISGDMDDATSEIATLLSRTPVKVRKKEKGTQPNLFYIDADDASLDPNTAPRESDYMWTHQARGVGHYARAAADMAYTNPDVVMAAIQAQHGEHARTGHSDSTPNKSISVLLNKQPKRVYDAPDKGILWGWEVSAYVWTKAIAAGAFLVPAIAQISGIATPNRTTWIGSLVLSLFFLTATGALLVKDLDQPKRFLYVLLRPQWKSWLTRGGYAITLYGAIIALLLVDIIFGWNLPLIMPVGIIVAGVVAIYTAFLFAQARGRDFWQSPSLPFHMLIHSIMAGSGILLIASLFMDSGQDWLPYLSMMLLGSVAINGAILFFELVMPHQTADAHRVSQMITSGRYKVRFWTTVVLLGNIVPFLLLSMNGSANVYLFALAGLITLFGIYQTEKIWVEAPQRIPLS